jgi:dTDP-4-dehydrorhamnose 3,5-epimerase
MAELTVSQTAIPGLLVINLVEHIDERGSFREVFHDAKMKAQGFPDFNIVQQNIAYNNTRGVTRGIHAEPWDKFISLGVGEVFVAIADLRPGENFGKVHELTLTSKQALYVPRGCGNSYQTLTDNVVYSYLVNAHWQPDAKYIHVNVADDTLNVNWPIPLDQAIVSDKDRAHPTVKELKSRGELE